jgi:hypothetical protein
MGKMSELDLIRQDIELQDNIDAIEDKKKDYALDNMTCDEMEMKEPILDKGGVPRITQEIYYTCSSNGSKQVNIELTLKRFKDKLEKLQEEQ